MWKLIIADDEPKIRRGLKKLLNWNEYGIEIVGEAEDGEITLDLIKEKTPDIILLDINMPFINGLELLKKLRNLNNRCIVIIISGYDEFSYAQEALKLNVFNYVLKPVTRKNMSEIITEAVKKLESQSEENKYKTWIEKQLKENMYEVKKKFFCDLLEGKLTYDEGKSELKYFNINLKNNIGMIAIKVLRKSEVQILDQSWDDELLSYAICNFIDDEFKDIKDKFTFKDNKNNIILIINIIDAENWVKTGCSLEKKINTYLKCNILLEQSIVSNGILDMKNIYTGLINRLNNKKKYSPIVLYAISYIEKNYYLNNLNINNISNELEISPSYLSKILKKETGFSFIDYLTSTRIKKAMDIMNDPTVKIYDVAELVGYSSQHYFCRAFKKFSGLSPSDYKRGR